MSDDETRRLLAEVLALMASLDECPLCEGPRDYEGCHRKKWQSLRGKIKKVLSSAPN